MSSGITPELLGRLLDEQGPALALYARAWTDAGDDCVQEALIELARQQRTPENPVAWLFRVVRNRAISKSRSARRRQRHELEAGELWQREREGMEREGVGSLWPAQSFHDGKRHSAEDSRPLHAAEPDEIAAALVTLDDELREVIVARTWGGLGFEEIAALVGCSTSTAHRRYVAGLAALRERLEIACPTQTKTTGHTN